MIFKKNRGVLYAYTNRDSSPHKILSGNVFLVVDSDENDNVSIILTDSGIVAAVYASVKDLESWKTIHTLDREKAL